MNLLVFTYTERGQYNPAKSTTLKTTGKKVR